MDLYILDSLFRKNTLIDDFISLIWTERYIQAGDFELRIASTINNRSRFVPETYLAIDQSERVMVIKSIEDTWEQDEGRILKVTGTSMEMFLDERVTAVNFTILHDNPMYMYYTPDATMAWIFELFAVEGRISAADKISPIERSNVVGRYNVPSFSRSIQTPLMPPRTVYEVLVDIGTAFDIGFSFTRKSETGVMSFKVYNGTDRTSSQTTYPSVLFTKTLESLENTTQYVNSTAEKNVAYVYGSTKNIVVAPENINPNIAGYDRRVLIVMADDIVETNATLLTEKMIARGLQELMKHQRFRGFDGEVRKDSPWIYQRDYFLGDVVEMRDDEGFTNRARVTEQIFSSDRNGDKSYPTLSVRTLAISDTWALWKSDRVWADLTTEEWSTV